MKAQLEKAEVKADMTKERIEIAQVQSICRLYKLQRFLQNIEIAQVFAEYTNCTGICRLYLASKSRLLTENCH